MSGIFYGIGVGPGEPDLLTVRAVHTIEQVDVIIAPKTEKKDGSVALSIAKPYLKADVQIVYQVFPMIKGFAKTHTADWQKNTDEIMALLQQGKNVAFLTLGDPMFYSTYIYIFRRLEKAGAQIETVPGVSAYAAIASKIGYPIVEGDNVLSIIPATAPLAKIEQALKASDHAVLMKVYKNFPEIVQLLEQNDMLEQAALVSRSGLDGECVLRGEELKQHDEPLNYLTTILTRQKKEMGDC